MNVRLRAIMGLSSLSLSILLIHLFLFSITTTSIDISPGSTLYAAHQNQTWSSPNKTFSLGFVPTATNSFIAAIAYDGGIPIWQAGGTTTSVDDGATLQFLSSGNLLLADSSGAAIWESNTTALGVSAATLDDSGNLVLKNGTIPVWSTFDNPTYTIVPSQNFTVDRVLQNGFYSFRLISSGNLILTWNGSIDYWTLGLNSSFDVNLTSPSLSLQSIGTLSISDLKLIKPVIVAYSSDYVEGSDILRFLRLDSDGNLRIYSSVKGSGTSSVRWSALADQCQVFGYCGNMGICSYIDSSAICRCPSQNFDLIDPNDTKKGCKRKVEIEDCSTIKSMLELDHAQFLTYPPETSSETYTAGISACESNCLVSDSCIASTALSDGRGICYLKTPGFLSGYQSPALPSTSYIKVCGPVVSNQSPSLRLGGKDWKLDVWIVAIIVVGALFGLILLEGVLWCWCCRNSHRVGGLSAQYAFLEYASVAPIQFSFKELQRATKGCKEKLGEGGFGAAYKGILANKMVVAVKQLLGIEQSEKQFRMEVATISSTHHINLVRLIGFCSEGRHKLLVYEFLKNGSLDKLLFATAEQQHGQFQNWEYRFNIALGTARGITYLHEECRSCIIHGNIKPENILLDENYNPKVSDFGLAEVRNLEGHSFQNLTNLRESRGYLAPEWLANLPMTSKSDVYSYGMVLLEIVSGKRNFEVSAETNRKKFSVWAYGEFEKGNVLGIVDKRFADLGVELEQVMRAIQVSFWCIQEQPSQRPRMGKVVQMLEGIMNIEKPPAPMASMKDI